MALNSLELINKWPNTKPHSFRTYSSETTITYANSSKDEGPSGQSLDLTQSDELMLALRKLRTGESDGEIASSHMVHFYLKKGVAWFDLYSTRV